MSRSRPELSDYSTSHKGKVLGNRHVALQILANKLYYHHDKYYLFSDVFDRPLLVKLIMQPQNNLRDFLAPFAADFLRRDQFRWATLYISGLLAALPRKNIETIARHLATEHGEVGQGLQNFIQRSPWDEQRLWKRYRAQVLRRLSGPDGLLVLQEVTFRKQGQHSVGVHRQFSNALGEKVSCQLAIGAYYVGREGIAPLTLRLYLPNAWLEDPRRLISAGVPASDRRSITKAEIGLRILDELAAEGISPPHLLAHELNHAGWRDDLVRRGYLHFAEEKVASRQYLANLPHLQEVIDDVNRGWDGLRDLGLDHFEGRSWRGFHHHACLTMLAAEAARLGVA